MTEAIPFLVSLITTGRLHGVGPGSTLDEVDRAIDCSFFDDIGDGRSHLRRDYGFFEFAFNADPEHEWVMSGVTVELHRLAGGRERAEEWRAGMRVDFPRYLAWTDLREALSRVAGVDCLKEVDQGGFLEHRYRAPGASVAVIVNDDHEERGPQLGHGDVWSVSLWAAKPA
ncbi:hypothetical protein OG883_28715 [Streptomyces sp. NBC_01142]|uniref:hypothetical protein n=1 Tax=Streptomyces sp. NBC_01142 TaxID=2975865 RepID=UPI00225C23E1|nr:hypothetical protein [Streptomyces sp. NBC_01142]MCX4823786.1 hypothetical protein [Streptomyces sp. NBC_01142]